MGEGRGGAMAGGGALSAQRPVFHVYEPKTTDAHSDWPAPSRDSWPHLH